MTKMHRLAKIPRSRGIKMGSRSEYVPMRHRAAQLSMWEDQSSRQMRTETSSAAGGLRKFCRINLQNICRLAHDLQADNGPHRHRLTADRAA
jgi:hypothetical protein